MIIVLAALAEFLEHLSIVIFVGVLYHLIPIITFLDERRKALNSVKIFTFQLLVGRSDLLLLIILFSYSKMGSNFLTLLVDIPHGLIT